MTQEQETFLKGQDFMRLGQHINMDNRQAAGMTLRRMMNTAAACDLRVFDKWFMGIRSCIAAGDKAGALQLMTLVTAKRVQYLNDIMKREEE